MPVIGRNSQRRSALVAAASQVEFDNIVPFRPEPDSDRLWGYYHALGEVWYVANFKAAAARRLTYFPGLVEDPDQDPDPVDSGPALEAFERVQGLIGDFGDCVAELCPHLTVVGEGFFVGGDTDGFDVWSSDEMRHVSSGQTIMRHQDEIDNDSIDFKLRIWRPDPQWRHKSDSPLRSVQTEADTILALRDMLLAVTRSRITSKILAIPSEASFLSNNDEPEHPDQDPFDVALSEVFMTSVQEQGAASRFAPIILRMMGESIGQMKEFDLSRDVPEQLESLMTQSIKRLANGLDFPAAMLTGIEDLNHWSAWVIEESTYKQHVDPLVQLILDSLTRGYLWPYLREAGMAEDQVQMHRFWRDYSDLTARTASVETTLAAYTDDLISSEAARKYLGFNEADAPEGIRELPAGVEIVEDLPADRDNTKPGPPLVAAATPATDLGDIDQRLFTQISEAAQAALDRAFERAANRIRNEIKPNRGGKNAGARAERYPAAFATIEGLTGRDVSLALGGKVVRETLQLTDDDLIPESTFETFRQRVQRILSRGQDETHQAAQQLLNTELERSPEEESWVERAAGFLTAVLTGLALRRLFTPDPTPDPAETGEIPDTDIPAGDVFDTLTIAGGGEPATAPDQPRGLATGQQTEVWIQEAGAVKEGFVWRTGSPSQPFEPHQNLSGTRFERWTSEVLATPGYASWLRTPYMYPGDHRGCQCVAVPVIETVVDSGDAT